MNRSEIPDDDVVDPDDVVVPDDDVDPDVAVVPDDDDNVVIDEVEIVEDEEVVGPIFFVFGDLEDNNNASIKRSGWHMSRFPALSIQYPKGWFKKRKIKERNKIKIEKKNVNSRYRLPVAINSETRMNNV